MTILQEMQITISKADKDSVLKYLPGYLKTVKRLNEEQYTEILSIILSEGQVRLEATKTAMNKYRKGILKYKAILMENPRNTKALAGLNTMSKGFLKSQRAMETQSNLLKAATSVTAIKAGKLLEQVNYKNMKGLSNLNRVSKGFTRGDIALANASGKVRKATKAGKKAVAKVANTAPVQKVVGVGKNVAGKVANANVTKAVVGAGKNVAGKVTSRAAKVAANPKVAQATQALAKSKIGQLAGKVNPKLAAGVGAGLAVAGGLAAYASRRKKKKELAARLAGK